MNTIDEDNKRLLISIYKGLGCPFSGYKKCLSYCCIDFWCRFAAGSSKDSIEYKMLIEKIEIMLEQHFTEEELFEALL